MENMQKSLKEYLDYLELEKNRSIKTRENYERYLRSFIKFGDIKNVEDINIDKVMQFRLWLARKDNNGEND